MSKKHKILVVDDRVEWLETIELILGDDYDLTLVNNPQNIEMETIKNDFSLIILDKNLPHTSGLEILKDLRENGNQFPAIILTRFPDFRTAVESMKLGAIDYISKGTKNFSKVIIDKVKGAIESSQNSDLSILELISRGESCELEFKSTVRWDMRENRLNKDLEKVIIKTVASLLNSEKGGNLLIGVDDSGTVLGLVNDYKTLGKRQDKDGFENFLNSLIFDAYGKEFIPFIEITFHQIYENEICKINLKPSPKPVFVKDEKGENLYVRTGNSTRLLSTREAIEFCKIRFKELN